MEGISSVRTWKSLGKKKQSCFVANLLLIKIEILYRSNFFYTHIPTSVSLISPRTTNIQKYELLYLCDIKANLSRHLKK
ncbi:hypothetical protein HZS_1737 [Henneguya salminicola]|nr:hypothetical protein HZS_1737 [Henneguya salminicola]